MNEDGSTNYTRQFEFCVLKWVKRWIINIFTNISLLLQVLRAKITIYANNYSKENGLNEENLILIAQVAFKQQLGLATLYKLLMQMAAPITSDSLNLVLCFKMNESLDYQYFHKYFTTFRSFDSKTFDLALQHANNYSMENGLNEEDLILIAQIAFKQQLGVTRLRKVIKCLIPRRTMPDEVVEYVLDWFIDHYNQNISLFAIKNVLQWFIGLIQYNLIDPSKTIRCYYDLYWYFLKFEVTLVQVCNLIYLLATPNDVSRWYVKQILKVHEDFQKPKCSGALLLLFKSYRPDCVPEFIPAYAVQKAFGTLPDFISKNFAKAQERLESSNIIVKDVDGICWHNIISKNVKRNAVVLIPNIIESEIKKLDGGKPLTSITNPNHLYKYLVQGNSPNRVLSLLSNKEGRFILTFGDNVLHERFSFQLSYTLYEAFFVRNPNVSYEERDNLLKKVAILQNQLQQGIPVVSKFLAQFIIKWDGLEHEVHIYNLLEWLHIDSYTVLEECILNFLYNLFISGTVETKCKILNCLGHFAVNIINTYFYRILQEIPFLFLNPDIKWNFSELISDLYKYITKLCKLGWTLEDTHSLLTLTIIEINSLIIDAEEKCSLRIWRVPDFIFRYGLFTSSTTVFLEILRFFNRFPSHVNESLKKDYLNSLIHEKAFGSEKGSIFNHFSENQIKMLKDLLTNINNSLNYDKHLALSCYYHTTAKTAKANGKTFEDLMKIAENYCPELLEFFKNNVIL